jgi:YbgC/YbaW family acyl-CoA thioester hydrolase
MMQPPVSLTVYPDDCDAFGHLNQAAFFTLFERARWEALALGPGMDLFERAGVWPAVRRATIDYQAPGFPGQVLRFQQVVTRLGRTSFTMRQVARRATDDTLLATLESVFVCIDRSGAAVPVPPEVTAYLSPAPAAIASDPPRRVTVHGIELAFDDRGTGPAMLLLHGYPLDRTLWRHQLGAFEGWRILAPDLRGFGSSDAPDLGYSMATYADDLIALLDAIGVDDVVLCGLSMGGYVTFELLRQHRPRVRGLVLVDTRAGADSAEGRKGRETAMADLRDGGSPLIAEQMLPRLLGPKAPDALREDVRRMMASAPAAGVLGALAAMRDRADSSELLPTLAGLPTLVMVGAEDRLTPPRDAEAMAKAIPGGRLALIPDAGHLPPLEQPEVFNRHLRAFLDRLAGSLPAAG